MTYYLVCRTYTNYTAVLLQMNASKYLKGDISYRNPKAPIVHLCVRPLPITEQQLPAMADACKVLRTNVHGVGMTK